MLKDKGFWTATGISAVAIFFLMIFSGDPSFPLLAGAVVVGSPVLGLIYCKAAEMLGG